MKMYEPPTKEFFRLPNKIFQVPLDATQFKLYAYLVRICCRSTRSRLTFVTISAKQAGTALQKSWMPSTTATLTIPRCR